MDIKKTAARFIATTGYIGLSPMAPGTMGTIGSALAAFFLMGTLGFGLLSFTIITIVLAILGVWAVEVELKSTRKKDPAYIVIDEWLAYWLLIILYMVTMNNPRFHIDLTILFGLFRWFDITKPRLVKRAEALPGWQGVMLDDFVAAMYAFFIYAGLQFGIRFLAWAGLTF